MKIGRAILLIVVGLALYLLQASGSWGLGTVEANRVSLGGITAADKEGYLKLTGPTATVDFTNTTYQNINNKTTIGLLTNKTTQNLRIVMYAKQVSATNGPRGSNLNWKCDISINGTKVFTLTQNSTSEQTYTFPASSNIGTTYTIGATSSSGDSGDAMILAFRFVATPTASTGSKITRIDLPYDATRYRMVSRN